MSAIWLCREGVTFDLYSKDGAFRVAHIQRGEVMKNKRFLFVDRRHEPVMPMTPFKDSNGATIKECRRKIPDRRIDNVSAKLVNVIR